MAERDKRGASRTLFQRSFYIAMRLLSRWVGVTLFDFRCQGRDHFPLEGGGLVLSTHQSNFDPVLVGLTCNRRMNYLARKTLFRSKPFAWLIRTLDAIEIDRDGMGLGGIKETLIRLKRGELVLIFPEGTRTKTGSIGELKPGFLAIARRARVPLLPVAVVGAFDVLPRGTSIPRRRPISVVVGKAILPQAFDSLSDEELMQCLAQRLADLDREGRKLLPLVCSR